MVFKTNDTEAMRIDSSGNVGIGCSDSQTPLEIDTSTANYRIQFTHTGGQNLIKSIDSDHSTMRSLFYDASEHVYQISGTEAMRIDSSGRFGFSGTYPPTSAQFMRIEEEFTTNRIMRLANRDNSGNSATFEVGHADNNEGAHVIIAYHGCLLYTSDAADE